MPRRRLHGGDGHHRRIEPTPTAALGATFVDASARPGPLHPRCHGLVATSCRRLDSLRDETPQPHALPHRSAEAHRCPREVVTRIEVRVVRSPVERTDHRDLRRGPRAGRPPGLPADPRSDRSALADGTRPSRSRSSTGRPGRRSAGHRHSITNGTADSTNCPTSAGTPGPCRRDCQIDGVNRTSPDVALSGAVYGGGTTHFAKTVTLTRARGNHHGHPLAHLDDPDIKVVNGATGAAYHEHCRALLDCTNRRLTAASVPRAAPAPARPTPAGSRRSSGRSGQVDPADLS